MSEITDIVYSINHIEICPYGNNELRRNSIARKLEHGLNIPETITKGEHTRGGVSDPGLGSTNASEDCTTCGLSSNNLKTSCDGHIGHITLPVPMYNPVYIERVRKILSCLCIECSRIPIEFGSQLYDRLLQFQNISLRIDEIKKAVSNIKLCPFCNNTHIPTIRKDARDKKDKKDKDNGILTIYAEYTGRNVDDDNKKQETVETVLLTSEIVYKILENMSDDDISFMLIDPNVFRPSDLLHFHWPISAATIRPSVKIDPMADSTSEDELTKKSCDVVRQCEKITNLIKANKKDKAEKLYNFLQGNINVFAVGPKSDKGNKVIKSIAQRTQSKEGRLRHNLQGKRTNFCARTVISSDPNISISESGIPKVVAMTLTIPETVRKDNIKVLTKYVRNGRNVYPGANYVKRKNAFNDTYIDLKHASKYINLKEGDVVERHLQNGDPVLFNRQPSLHKMGIMCHRARIIMNDELSVFRLNVNVTDPYNADFDGDEMNLYLGQYAQTLIEYYLIANVDKQIISPAYSLPSLGFKQDTPAGIYALTEQNEDIDWHYAMNVMLHIENSSYKISKKPYKSYDLFSEIIPPMINFTKWNDDGTKQIEIVNGKLIKGRINRSVLAKALIMSIWDRHGPTKTRIFIDNAQRLAEMILFHKGISIGYKDAVPDENIRNKAKTMIFSKMMEGLKMLTEIENNPSLMDYDTFESSLFSTLSVVRSNVSNICMKNSTSANKFFLHVDSGAKGNSDNVGSILGSIGQQVLKFARISKVVNGRSLPHFCKDDDTPKARGYIINSYTEGASPSEYWFYVETAREGIINTAIKTADTGYQQRRLIKALESVKVENDGTVRTADGIILQILYGDNQLDQVMQKRVHFKSMEMNNEQLEKVHLFNPKDIKKDFVKVNRKFVDKLFLMRNKMRVVQLKSHLSYGIFLTSFFQGANYPRIINDIVNISDPESDIVEPEYVMEKIDHILSHKGVQLLCYNDGKSNIKAKDERKFKFLLKYGLYEFLSPKRCVKEYKLSKEKFDRVVDEVIASYNKAIVHAGEMVGILAAQSMGEPLTQMVLSSFHKSGAGVAGLRGAPRIKEILANGKNIQTPIMYIYLKPEYRKNKDIAKAVAANLSYTTCKNIINSIETIYDPEGTRIKEDNIDTSSIFDAVDGNKKIDVKSFPWLYRIHVSKEKMLEYSVSMLDIKVKFLKFWKNNINSNKKTQKDMFSQINSACISTNYDNSVKPMIHIRLDLNDIDSKTLLEFRTFLINSFHIKGDEKITSIDSIREDDVYVFDEETGDHIKEQEYVIYTNGINMEKIRTIPQIDQNRTICNDIRTMTEFYGIESTRSTLIKEVSSIYTGTPMNYHHITITCDFMTHTGNITSIDRFGLKKLKIGVLAKATFEESMDLITDAAFNNLTDNLNNVSSSILVGKPFNGGTGLCDLSMDTEMLEKSEYNDSNILENSTIKLSKTPVINDILGKKSKKNLFIPNFE